LSNQIFRQILLITDGCSNVGTDPVYAAQVAKEKGVAVNVIALLDRETAGRSGQQEAQNIAAAGGGLCRIVTVGQLAQTMQMVTQQTMQLTLQQVVNRELRAIVGQETEELPPETRMRVAKYMDDLGDAAELHLALTIDMSASMLPKIPAMRDAIRDLELSLQARSGHHELAIVAFPGEGGEDVAVLCRRGTLAELNALTSQLKASGSTPTGPAIVTSMNVLLQPSDGGVPRKGKDERPGGGEDVSYVV